MFSCNQEPYVCAEREILALLPAYAEETGGEVFKKTPLSLHTTFYRALADAGALQLVVLRWEGKMVGFCTFIVRPHNHFSSTLCGMQDGIYIVPQFRKGIRSVKLMLKVSLEGLRRRGVKKVYASSMKGKDLTPLFLYLGFREEATVCTLWMGE